VRLLLAIALALLSACASPSPGAPDVPVDPGVSPAITAEPADAVRSVGATVTFTAAASGTPAPALQWERRGAGEAGFAPVAGATGASLTTPALALADSGARYRLRAVNATGEAVSREAAVEVVALPAIQAFTISAAKLTAGDAATLAWAFTGGEGVLAGEGAVAAAGAREVTPAATRAWTLTVTNAAGDATSRQVAVEVFPAPIVSAFAALAPYVPPGDAAALVATFDAGPGGSAAVDHGVGPVASGVAAPTGAVTAATTFTLTVTNGAGRALTRTAQVTLGIDVAPGGSIQAALDRATPGTTVHLAPGTYAPAAVTEAFLVLRAEKDGIVLRGEGASPAEVVLDGAGQALHVLYVAEGIGPATRIENLTVRGGRSDPYQLFPGYPAGFTSVLRPDVPLADDFFHDGAGIMLFRAAPVLSRLEVRDNYAFRCGAGVSIFAQGKVGFPATPARVEHSFIHDNVAGSGTGGGVDVYYGARAELVNGLFVDNGGWGAHVAILDGATALVRSCTFDGGASVEGGVVATPNATAEVRDSIFANTPAMPPLSLQGPGTVASHCAFWNAPAGFTVSGAGHVLADALFVDGPGGGHYLAQAAAGQAATSPCVDAGSGAASALPGLSTRTDGAPDAGTLDLGYHHTP